MEYAPLAWMSASETQLRKLDDIQQRAQKIIKAPPGTPSIDTLPHRRTVAGLGLVYKLHTKESPEQMRAMLPPLQRSARMTRSSQKMSTHALQGLTGRTQSGQWSLHQYDRSFLPATIPVWNSLPNEIVGQPHQDGTKKFCQKANRFLTSQL